MLFAPNQELAVLLLGEIDLFPLIESWFWALTVVYDWVHIFTINHKLDFGNVQNFQDFVIEKGLHDHLLLLRIMCSHSVLDVGSRTDLCRQGTLQLDLFCADAVFIWDLVHYYVLALV